MPTLFMNYKHQAKYSLRYAFYQAETAITLVTSSLKTSESGLRCIQTHCKHLYARYEGRNLLIVFEQDVAEMRNVFHGLCNAMSFTTGFCTTSSLKYFKSGLED